VEFGGKKMPVAQTNNSYIFPGLGLGIIASKAKRVTDAMILAAAKELARLVPTATDKTAKLLPSIADARKLSRSIAAAVGRQAMRDGEAQVGDEASLEREIEANIWEPVYIPYERCQF
jgi:malate dehydrogenase (oxaloacetate-decarboxylating)